jgi:hypothetical protein
MASIVEKTSEGIVYKPSRTMEVPDLDVLTLLFGKTGVAAHISCHSHIS